MRSLRNHLCALALSVSLWAFALASRLNRETVERLLEPHKQRKLQRKEELCVYVAAPKAEIVRALNMVLRLRGIPGVTIVSRWHDVYVEGTPDPDAHAEAERLLRDNVADLRRADLLVALTSETDGRGTYCEIGRALEREIDVVWSLERGGRALDWADQRVLPVYSDDAAAALVADMSPKRARHHERRAA